SLTWSAELAEDNDLVAGQWWHHLLQTECLLVSVESELADSLGIGLGDQLGLIVDGTRFESVVSSIRRVNWDNFTPNFYMVLYPGALEGMPTTLLTSFHLPVEQREGLRELTRAFPAITLLEVEAILEQLRDILQQVTLAVEYVLVF